MVVQVTLQEIIKGNFIHTPCKIRGVCNNTSIEANIVNDHTIQYGDKIFDNLSSAEICAKTSLGQVSTADADGWTFWSFCDHRDSKWKQMEYARKVFQHYNEQVPLQAAISRLNLLMLKFKYDTITNSELNDFEVEVSNMSWDRIWKENIPYKKDAQQEVWLRLLRKKHNWDETKGFKFSTWFYRVAFSSIMQLREDEGLADIPVSSYLTDQDDVSFFEGNIVDRPEEREHDLRCERVREFCGQLTGTDAVIVNLVIKPNVAALAASNAKRRSKRSKMYRKDIADHLGMSINELNEQIYDLRERFNAFMDCHADE